jgi:8-amino-7-oxononanoate synthase
MKLSRASKCIPFAHNSVPHLRHLLETLVAEDSGIARGTKNIFIAVESVYSMDGDLAPLAEIRGLATELLPHNNGHIVVDEAHATGVLGPKGRGLVSQLGLEKDVFARLHTFGKGLACSGAIVLCSPVVRSYLINYARPLIYTTFMPFPSLAAIKASYSLLSSGGTETLAAHLRRLVVHLHSRLHDMLAKYSHHLDLREILDVSVSCPESPIFALLTQHPRDLAKCCQDKGFVVRAVVPPTVPTRRVRVCLHAGNSFQEVDKLVEIIERWVDGRISDRSANGRPTNNATLIEAAEPIKARL